MSQYFYAVSTLPLLSFDQERAPSSEEFLEMCRAQLEPADFELLSRAQLIPKGPTPEIGLEFESLLDDEQVVVSWLNWESRLRDELVRLRSQKLESEGSRYLSGAPYASGTYDVAREAVGAASPLEGEEIIDRARWRYLDELETGHFFDVARLVVYYLKLQLLERRSLFERERGEARFGELYAGVMPESISEQYGQTNVESAE